MPEAIIGREREFGAVAEFLAALERGSAALVFAGEPGIGKTTLWREAVARAQEQVALTVLTARPVQAEGTLAFAALADLLEAAVDDVLARLPEPQRRAMAVALLREDPGERRLDQRAVSAAATAVLAGLARKGRVVLAVDDLQWLDRASARVLEFALRRLDELPVGLLACERIGADRKVVLEVERVLPEERVTRLQLRPLSVAALHEVVEARLGRSLARRAVVRIHQLTGGNPFFALEIARALPGQASPGLAAMRLPESLLGLVDARIAALPKRVRASLLPAAVLRSPTVELVAAVLGGSAAEARRALEQAAAVGVVEVADSRVRFSHPLFAAAVYSSALPAERRRAHRRLARFLLDVEERALHLALGAEAADADLATILDAAAEHAGARGAPEAAVELTEQAWRLTPPDRIEDIQRRSVRAAEYRFHAGELRGAHELLEAVLEQASWGRVRADALRLLGEIRYHEQSFPEAISLFEEALEHVGDDRVLAATIELHLTFAANAAGDWAGGEPHAHRALTLTENLGDEPRLAEALAVSAMQDYLRGRGLDEAKLERALELEDERRQTTVMMRPTLIAGFLMLYEGRLGRSCDLLRRLRQRVLERGEESELPFLSSHLAWGECWRGRLAAAAAYANEALEMSARIGMDSMRCSALAFASLPAAYLGDAEAVRANAQEALALASLTGFHIATIWARWSLGILALSLGDARGADAALAPLTALVEAEGLEEPVRAMFLADAIEALVVLGELDRAGRLIDALEQAGSRLARGWVLVQAGRCRALLLAALGDLDRAACSAYGALAVDQDLELRLELARTLLVSGQIERRRRRKRAARELLERALEIFEWAGAALWMRRAQAELERAAGRPAGEELTVSEERVARLAATGLTNREVAARLFVSSKTVEANLARVYRKLGIRSRAELGTRIVAGRAPAQM